MRIGDLQNVVTKDQPQPDVMDVLRGRRGLSPWETARPIMAQLVADESGGRRTTPAPVARRNDQVRLLWPVRGNVAGSRRHYVLPIGAIGTVLRVDQGMARISAIEAEFDVAATDLRVHAKFLDGDVVLHKLGVDENLYLQALSFILTNEDRRARFIDMTGLAADALECLPTDPAGLGTVLDHLLRWEPLLLEFCAANEMKPEQVVAARRLLPGAAPSSRHQPVL